MKVAWISHSGDLAGGAQICVLEGARALAGRGVTVNVVAPGNGTLVQALEADGFDVVEAPVPEWVRWWDFGPRTVLRPFVTTKRLLQSSDALKRVLLDLGSDVVLTNTLATAAGAVAARRAGVPHVWYVHEFGREDHGMRYDFGEGPSFAVVGRLSARVLANSEAVAAKLESRQLAAPVEIVRYAVEVREPDDSPPVEDGSLRLVLVGRLTEAKGQRDAIHALAEARHRGVPAQLTVVGGDLASPYGRDLRALAAQLGVADHVEFTGAVADPRSHVAAAHAALMCSRCEAFGRVTVEAMKLGLPVIGASSGGTTELIEDGQNGLLYPPGDADELAHRIEQLWNEPGKRAQMGRTARAWSTATFSRERHGAALSDALNAALTS